MKSYWNTKFTERDYECTNVVVIKADALPKRFDPAIWKDYGPEAVAVVKKAINLQYLGTTHENGQSYEQYGYL